jgi:hypothetical protein
MMITRTLLRPNHSTSDTPSNLTLPEVFLFGGRNKAGKYQPLSQVYKFCAGSTGEKPYPMSPTGARIAGPDDATCDAYHSTTNPNSTNPQAGYIGRWLFKNPKLSSSPGTFDINPDLVGSYLGAAVYDPSHDLILAYGGLTPNALATPQASTSTNLASTWAVTSPTNQQLNNTDGSIYEYTPPSSVQGDPVTSPRIHGMWSRITPCTGPTPTARYGHSLVYDPLKQIVILTGGLDASGAPLTTSITNSSGTTYSVPETWTLQRNDSTSYNPCYNWTKVTNFGNQTDTLLNLPVNSGVAHAATFLIPATGYNTGYYTMNGPSCAGIGTVTGTDQNMGGIYIDIDRTRLGANDNLLLNLTLFPLGTSNIDTTGNAITSAQSAFFRVSLVSTGQSALQLQNQTQPRALIYSDTGSFPVKAYNLAILAPPTGQIRQEQVFIPLAIDPTIDRIRVERISGTGLILDATINRLPHS